MSEAALAARQHDKAKTVAELYSGRVLLLTGATGFLGKVLLEKLLWEGLAVRPLRLLARGDPATRLGKLKASQIFSRLRRRVALEVGAVSDDEAFDAWFAAQVQCFSCDLEVDGLGLTADDRRAIFSGIDIVMHCAARVSWDERLDVAIRANTLGTRQLLAACAGEAEKQRPPVFLHVSSAFVHGMAPCPHTEVMLPKCSIRSRLDGATAAPRFDIEEIISAALEEGARTDAEFAAAVSRGAFHEEALARLPPESSVEEVHAMEQRIAERRARTHLSQHGVDVARQHGWWDPYTVSKAMAEMCLEMDAKEYGLPLIVIRPSGISSCAREPTPGWIDCYLLNEPIIEATGRGQLTAFPGRVDSVLDMVPADFVVNLILVASTRPPEPGVGPEVYQCSSGDINPVHQGDLAQWWYQYFREFPFRNAKGHAVMPVQPKLIGSLEEFLARMRWRAGIPVSTALSVASVLPGSIHWVRNLRDRLGKMRGAVDNAMRLASLYSVYTIERFDFRSDKGRAVLKSLCEEDRRLFDAADCGDIDWKAYFAELHIPGMRKYVLKERSIEPLALEETRALSRRKAPVSRL